MIKLRYARIAKKRYKPYDSGNYQDSWGKDMFISVLPAALYWGFHTERVFLWDRVLFIKYLIKHIKRCIDY